MASIPTQPHVREYQRGPLTAREQCYDVWFPMFGFMVFATVVVDGQWFVENPHLSMMLTEVEWVEWDSEARRIVAEHLKS